MAVPCVRGEAPGLQVLAQREDPGGGIEERRPFPALGDRGVAVGDEDQAFVEGTERAANQLL